ncbi:uncharacterized protein EI97DRAFT_59669 [Westerdykella ornata]|uniref:Myb-like domain-containing protein n=1 Tax=Westerdykella ornata TaxID=318751 RepID=A0A6A6JH52_WESOR|nr:uncharacterized protein EI97DRAFT_59669 [Westerdykella ornata]KAF2275891.1 hypothetical protein EI97DRAFT_59669 [Westerdykella ornata]
MTTMPKVDKTGQHAHRHSISTASAAGNGARSSTWTSQDDDTLIKARASGLNWNQIAPRHFPNKTPNACRKRHERLMERQNAEQWDGVKLDVLAQAYMDVRREMWSLLAARVGEKWQIVETKCMEKGLKNLNQAYRSAQKKQGTYDDDHGDSGIGHCSDLDEEHEERMPSSTLSDVSGPAFTYQQTYTAHSHHQRVPSIQNMLQFPGPTHPLQHH